MSTHLKKKQFEKMKKPLDTSLIIFIFKINIIFT
jgi:hypothetical protein